MPITTPTMSTVIPVADLPEAHRDYFKWPECIMAYAAPNGRDMSAYVRTCQPAGLTNSYFRFTLDSAIYCVTPAQSLWQAVSERWAWINGM